MMTLGHLKELTEHEKTELRWLYNLINIYAKEQGLKPWVRAKDGVDQRRCFAYIADKWGYKNRHIAEQFGAVPAIVTRWKMEASACIEDPSKNLQLNSLLGRVLWGLQ